MSTKLYSIRLIAVIVGLISLMVFCAAETSTVNPISSPSIEPPTANEIATDDGEEFDEVVEFIEISPEEELDMINEELADVKEQCIEIQQEIDEAKLNKTAQIDSELPEILEECQEYAQELEQEAQMIESSIESQSR